MDGQASSDSCLPLLVVGSARLPKAIVGESAGSLMIEIELDSEGGGIVGVATTVSLPGYTRLLQRLLTGRPANEIEHVAQRLPALLRGPLLRPTIAALTNAAANRTSVERNGEKAGGC